MASTPRLFLLMSQAQHRLRKTTDTALKDALGITTAQLGVLFLLEKTPGMLAKDVSEALKLNPSAITGLIDRMEEAGLVRRKPCADDERAAHLFATADGIERAVAARPIIARLNTRLTADFTDREIAIVARFLAAVLDRF